MKEIVFNNKTYQCPTSWDEVTIEMLIKASELSEFLEDAPIIAIISAYTGIPVKELRVQNVNAVNSVVECLSFINAQYVPVPSTGFDFNGCRYECEADITNQKFEDWVSVQTCLFNYKDEQHRALPRLLAILCKKDGETLADFDLNHRTTEFMKLPMTKAKDVEGFFLHSLNAYKGLTLLSSMTNVQQELILHKVQELQNTMKRLKAHTGMFSGTRLLIGLYQIQMWWVKKQLEKSFNSEPIKNSKNTLSQTCKRLLMRHRKRVK